MTHATIVDLNCDMGELPELAANGTQDQLLRYVTSVNIACGAHAGDEQLIEQTILAASCKGVSVGAHPGYPDPANFGRTRLSLSSEDLTASVQAQLEFFSLVARRCGAPVNHVKPHGALYNEAARDASVAICIAEAITRWNRSVLVFGLKNSVMLEVFREYGLGVVAEAFCDRRHEPDGTLRSRALPGALITDPAQAAKQALALIGSGSVQSLCLHSDTPNSVQIAASVCDALAAAGITLTAPVAR